MVNRMIECWNCKTTQVVVLNEHQDYQLDNGIKPKQIKPTLTDTETELLVSGTCNECLDSIVEQMMNDENVQDL